MKRLRGLLTYLILGTLICSCSITKSTIEGQGRDMKYLSQNVPSATPVLFAPNIISLSDRHEFGSVFSKDGNEMFFGIDKNGKSKIHSSKLENGRWTISKPIFQDPMFSYNDPMLSPDEQRLYFISDQSLDGKGVKNDIDIWYSERKDDSWSLPINAGDNINSSRNEYYISFTNTGTMYFSSNIETTEGKDYNFDIYYSKMTDIEFGTPVKLDERINSDRYEADVFIAPDESYIIFCARRRVGFGKGDLYVSFKDDNENWTPSKNMGDVINTEGHELCPYVTSDGKYFFYTREGDIYWVSTEIIHQMK